MTSTGNHTIPIAGHTKHLHFQIKQADFGNILACLLHKRKSICSMHIKCFMWLVIFVQGGYNLAQNDETYNLNFNFLASMLFSAFSAVYVYFYLLKYWQAFKTLKKWLVDRVSLLRNDSLPKIYFREKMSMIFFK